MTKNIAVIAVFSLFIATQFVQICYASDISKRICETKIGGPGGFGLSRDTTPPAQVMEVVKAAINSLNSFNIEAVANLYTPNAVVADDEPPFSWNGPTAGIQWVNAVERVCKENHLTKLKGSMASVSVYQQNIDNAYIVIPVTYTGDLPGKTSFEADGAFAFVLRIVNGKWMIKSQVWMPKRGM